MKSKKFYKPSKPVPTFDRSEVAKENAMGDQLPAGHHRYLPERWSGNLKLSLETRTPLLLLDGFSCKVDREIEHQTFGTRSHLLRTQLKGTLRSAYEMITNSRLGCVDSSFSEPLKYRPPWDGKLQHKVSYTSAPLDIFKRKNINPASCLAELSPAERVFGWVNPEGKGAYKGQLRVSRLEVDETDKPDEPSGPNTEVKRTLAPLASPKPEYVRFYGAKDLNGEPFPKGYDKNEGYTETAGDAGRNDYFTHPDKPERYFGAGVALEDEFEHAGRTYYPEYLAEPGNQNMTVRGEVPAGARFSACIQFHNLSGAELGALLWLLTLEEGAYYSVGSGKPFGFGSIKISLDRAASKAWRGKVLKARYAALLDPDKTAGEEGDRLQFEYDEPAQTNATTIEKLQQAFKDALEDAYGKKKSERLLRIFKQHRHGPPSDWPVHYPRKFEKPGEPGFKWFVANEDGGKLSPGDTWETFALPYQPVKPKKR